MTRKKPEPYKLGLLGGADEFEESFPEEMMRLGALTALWSLVESQLCHVLAALLDNQPKAEAAFYSTTNHKARRDLVVAVAKHSNLSVKAADHLNIALRVTKKAADLRNSLLHGLFQTVPFEDELQSVIMRPAAKVPRFTKKHIIQEIDAAIKNSELAIDLLGSAAGYIKWPNWPIDAMEALKAAAHKRKPSP